MPCDAIARVNALVTKQTLVAELFQQPELARQALIQLLSQLDGVRAVDGKVVGDALIMTLSCCGFPVRVSLTRATGTLSITGGDQRLLDRIRTLVEETGGALFQERIARTLRRVFGSRAEEAPPSGTARRLTIRL